METLPSDLNSKERKRLFFIELVRAGISFDEAYVVSEIVASAKPPEALTPQERWLVNDVCRKWLDERNRENSLQRRFEKLGMAHSSSTSSDKLDFFSEINNYSSPFSPFHQKLETSSHKEDTSSSKQPTVMAIARKLATLSHSSEKIRDVLILNGVNTYKRQYIQPDQASS